jgi:uncharacterized protein YceK
MVFMKLRISIIALGMSLLVNSGCSTVKSAYTGTEQSHFTNPAKIAAMNAENQGLAPVAEPPPSTPPSSYGAGGTGVGRMTGLSTQPQFQANSGSAASWGGALSTR